MVGFLFNSRELQRQEQRKVVFSVCGFYEPEIAFFKSIRKTNSHDSFCIQVHKGKNNYKLRNWLLYFKIKIWKTLDKFNLLLLLIKKFPKTICQNLRNIFEFQSFEFFFRKSLWSCVLCNLHLLQSKFLDILLLVNFIS